MNELLNNITIIMMSLLLSFHEYKDNHKIVSTMWLINASVRIGIVIAEFINNVYIVL